MKAIIVAGGKGERLRPLTYRLPKPMVEAGGKPIIEHIIDLFRKNGICDFIISVCYLSEKITDYFGDGKKFGVNIDYIYEKADEPLGTAGNISEAKSLIASTFIVTYADIVQELDLPEMIRFHERNNAAATINVYKRYGADPKSMIVFKKDGRIVSFKERPKEDEINGQFVWANGSFYIFEPEIFDLIPKNTFTDFGKDIFPRLLEQKKNFYAFRSDGFFADIGDYEKLAKARKYFEAKRG